MINIDIDSDAVQTQVVQSIINAGIGRTIEEVVKKTLQESPGYNKDTVIEAAIKVEVNKVIGQEVSKIIQGEEIRAQIRDNVVEMLTDEVQKKMMGAAIQVMLGNLDNAM
jgi:hypothetical protein